MNPEYKSVIVGTAGHIDHGKSTLIEALTGTHPDRLAEEKRRGITIDLGFAFLRVGTVRFGFVDVPGHERFVKNMLAGTSGIDLVLLVVAGDEGIKPQTREHFEICRLLGVKRGVVALTKCDLVDEDAAGLVRLEIEEFVKGSFLEGAPIVAVSAKCGRGLPELEQALVAAAEGITEKDRGRYFRLPIDRSFAVKGFGTVVTGTLVSGELTLGSEVELLPEGRLVRVRGLQTAGETVERASAGQRTAVNLAGIEHTRLHRGMVLAAPGRFGRTRRLDVRFELLPSAPTVAHRTRLHFHAGTAECGAELWLYQKAELGPGKQAWAQLRLEHDLVVAHGDRFIVRQFSPVVTIGGGKVLDPLARRSTQKDSGRSEFLKTLDEGTREEALGAMVQRNVLGLGLAEIVLRTGWQEGEVRVAAENLSRAGRVRIMSREPLTLLPTELFGRLCRKLEERVEAFQKENPLLPGIPREELRASTGRRVRPETFRDALAELAKENRLEVVGELVKKSGSTITLTEEEQRAKAQILNAFQTAGLKVPSAKEVLGLLAIENRRAEKILQLLLREKVLVRVAPELIFHQAALQSLVGILENYKRDKGEKITVPAFKELTGISRKYAIPLLEYLDRQRLTRRAGDERVIL